MFPDHILGFLLLILSSLVGRIPILIGTLNRKLRAKWLMQIINPTSIIAGFLENYEKRPLQP